MKHLRLSLIPLTMLALTALACNVLLPGGVNVPTVTPGAGAATDTPVAGPTEVTDAAPTETAVASPSATPASAASETPTAADTLYIAYIREGQLLVTDVTGGVLGGTTQYTQPGVDDGLTDFVWSPSGEFIAYTGLVGTVQHLFVVYAEGAGTPVDLGEGAVPAWSPDGTQLAYQNGGQIWITTVEAPAPRQLTSQTNWAWGRPAFMPDGLSLVVSGEAFDDMGASGNTTFWLYSLPLDGSGTLTPLPGMAQEVEGRLPYDLQFSPDGTKLAFSTSWHLSACASIGNYYVLNNDGSNLQTVVSPSLAAVVNDAQDDHLAVFGYDWLPDSTGLLMSGLVRDCTDFSGTVLAAQMSQVTLAGAEATIISGSFGPVSVNDAGTYIGTSFDDGSARGFVRLYDTTGALVLEVGEGHGAKVQP